MNHKLINKFSILNFKNPTKSGLDKLQMIARACVIVSGVCTVGTIAQYGLTNPVVYGGLGAIAIFNSLANQCEVTKLQIEVKDFLANALKENKI